VAQLEEAAPPPSNVLTSMALNGTWFLQYTSPSVLEEDNDNDNDNDNNNKLLFWKPSIQEGDIETRNANSRGTVTALAVKVDTSGARNVVTQSFDVPNERVYNDILITDKQAEIHVEGKVVPSQNVPTRALVLFDVLDIVLLNGKVTLPLGFVFPLSTLFKKSKEQGWLETTYLSRSVRIGRGNKGTCFILTRDGNAVEP